MSTDDENKLEIAGYCTLCGSPLTAAHIKNIEERPNKYRDAIALLVLIAAFFGLLILIIAGLKMIGVFW